MKPLRPKKPISRDRLNRFTDVDRKVDEEKKATRLWRFNEELKRKLREIKKSPKYDQAVEKAKSRLFRLEVARLRKKILSNRAQRQVAQKKIASLLSLDEEVIRVESIERVLSELGRNDSFAGKNAASTKTTPGKIFYDNTHDGSPERTVEYFSRSTAHRITQWGGLAKYNCLVYFEKEAFSRGHQYGGHLEYDWGYIHDLGHCPILAVQVMHWDPKVLSQVTKSMLKRRPNDPVAIVDCYGDPFYP